MASLLHTSIFLISSDETPEVWIFADKGYHGAGVRVKPVSKGCRLNLGDEAMIEIITVIRRSTGGRNAALKHENALKHVNPYLTVITTIAKSIVVLTSLHPEHDWRYW